MGLLDVIIFFVIFELYLRKATPRPEAKTDPVMTVAGFFIYSMSKNKDFIIPILYRNSDQHKNEIVVNLIGILF
jgi:hypothetical protein